MVFFSGMPSDAAGPVAESVMPTLMSASAVAATAESSAASMVFFIYVSLGYIGCSKVKTLLPTCLPRKPRGQGSVIKFDF